MLTKTLGERIRYVRENLVDSRGAAMTQDALAVIAGLKPGHHGVGGWETRGREPKGQARDKIAALSEGAYRPEVFSRAGAEVLVKEIAVPRLRRLEVQADEGRRALLAILKALDEHGIRVPLDEGAAGFLSTQASPGQAGIP